MMVWRCLSKRCGEDQNRRAAKSLNFQNQRAWAPEGSALAAQRILSSRHPQLEQLLNLTEPVSFSGKRGKTGMCLLGLLWRVNEAMPMKSAPWCLAQS